MSRKSLVLGTCLTAFAAVGCSEQATAPVAAPSPRFSASAPELSASYLQSLGARLPLVLPSSAVPLSKLFGDVGGRAINPGDYVCSNASSPVIAVLDAELARTFATASERALFFQIYNRSGDIIPTYEALIFGSSATPQTYGYNGQFTKQMVKVERDVKRFWDIPSSDIQVLAMHGTVLLDVQRTAATYVELGLPPAVALQWAQIIRNALLQSTTMNGGNYGFFTFNAFSYSDPSYYIPDKIVMGDGILEAYATIGLGDVAPQAIFAHEFAHQIQSERNYFNDLPTASAPEQTRYTELMADAMAAYFLTHARGASMNQKRVEQFLSVFFQIGDCAFTNAGHHGTPNQRMAAAQFGFALADQAQKQGHILTAAEFHAAFVAAYPSLVAPDAP